MEFTNVLWRYPVYPRNVALPAVARTALEVSTKAIISTAADGG